MSRLSSGNVQYVRASNNVYTVLVAIALVVEIVGFVVLIMQANTLFKAGGPGGAGPGLFG